MLILPGAMSTTLANYQVPLMEDLAVNIKQTLPIRVSAISIYVAPLAHGRRSVVALCFVLTQSIALLPGYFLSTSPADWLNSSDGIWQYVH